MKCKAWFTLATEAETEESLRSSVSHENGDGSTSGSSTEAETDRFLFLPSPLLLPSQTSKCEPILTEAQAETEG